MKSAPIQSYSGQHFSAFGLDTERYGISLRLQFKCWKMRTLHSVGCSLSGKSNALLSLVKHQLPDIDKIHLYVKDPFKVSVTYQRKKIGIKKLKFSKAFIDHSQTIDYVCENLEEFNPTKKRKVLIVFGDMMTEMKAY